MGKLYYLNGRMVDEKQIKFDSILIKKVNPHKTKNGFGEDWYVAKSHLKSELVEHLKTKEIEDVNSLWGEAKDYYKSRLIEMGGSYASFGKDITVTLKLLKEVVRFDVSIAECQK